MSESITLNDGEHVINFTKENSNELYAENKITWAVISKFPDERFFLITKDIFDLESYLSTHIYDHRQRIDGTGDSHGLNVLRDCLHHTRRYEYPYAILNIPHDTRIVLDVGGGSSFSYYVADRIEDCCVVLDIDQKVGDELELIKGHTRKFRNIHFKLGDARAIPFPDNSFDCTTCISVLEHMDDKNIMLALSEMMRVTKPSGVIIVTVDVQLTRGDEINLDDIRVLSKRLNMEVAPILSSTLFSSIGNRLYIVACMKFVGFKGDGVEL